MIRFISCRNVWKATARSRGLQEGTNRINVEIPGVYDAEKILEELGNPGTVQFYEVTDASAADMSDEEKAEAKKAAEAAGFTDSSTFNLDNGRQ